MVKASDLEQFGERRRQILTAYDYMVKMMELDMDQKEVEEKRSFPEQIEDACSYMLEDYAEQIYHILSENKDFQKRVAKYKETRQELKKRNDPLIEEYSKRTIARIEEERQIASLAGICVGVKLAQVFSLKAVDEIVRYCACMVPDMDDDEDEEYEETEE